MESSEASVTASYIQHLQWPRDGRALTGSPAEGVILSSWRGFLNWVGSRWVSMQFTKCMINRCNNLVTCVYSQHWQLQIKKEILELSLTPTAQWATAATKTKDTEHHQHRYQQHGIGHNSAILQRHSPLTCLQCAVLVSTSQGGCNVIGEAQNRRTKLQWRLTNSLKWWIKWGQSATTAE